MKLFAVVLIACALLSQIEAKQSRESDEVQDEWDILSGSNQASRSGNGGAADLLDAAPFRNKIAERLNKSITLSAKPEIKHKISKLADSKLNACMKPSGNSLYGSCVGQLTGQMMQLIRTVENMNRDLPGQKHFSNY